MRLLLVTHSQCWTPFFSHAPVGGSPPLSARQAFNYISTASQLPMPKALLPDNLFQVCKGKKKPQKEGQTFVPQQPPATLLVRSVCCGCVV